MRIGAIQPHRAEANANHLAPVRPIIIDRNRSESHAPEMALPFPHSARISRFRARISRWLG